MVAMKQLHIVAGTNGTVIDEAVVAAVASTRVSRGAATERIPEVVRCARAFAVVGQSSLLRLHLAGVEKPCRQDGISTHQ